MKSNQVESTAVKSKIRIRVEPRPETNFPETRTSIERRRSLQKPESTKNRINFDFHGSK